MAAVDKARSLESVPYYPAYAQQAQRLCQLGLDDEGLAFFFDVDRCTIERWRREHAEFRRGIELGSLALVSTVERETIRHITGYTATKQRVMRGKVVELRYWERGNADAGMKWLEMRCPERLRP